MKMVYAFLLLLTSGKMFAQPQLVSDTMQVADHPRLLMDPADELLIRQRVQMNGIWKTVHEAILRQCDSLVTLSPSKPVMTGLRLDADRYCLYRLFYLSYAWRISRERKYFDQAEKELLAIAAFKDWNPSHFLDVAELTMGVAIGYDWLYQDLPEKERILIRTAILTKGIAPSYDTAYHSYRKWLSVTNNWNQVCNTGISFGAMAVYETDPAFAKKVINRSLQSIVISMKDYDPDGACAEGYGYWSYGSTYNVFFLSGLQKMFHTDFGLDEQKGFFKSAGYLQHMVGPTDQCFNYSDVSPRVNLQPAIFWLAKNLNDPSLLWEDRRILSGPTLQSQMWYRFIPALIIWGLGMDIHHIPVPKENMWVGRGRNPVALMRTSWTDPAAIFVGLKGGSPSVTHGHMDVGSFVMESNGIRWAMDFGYQDYESLESKNIDLWEDKQDGQRWRIFRYNNFSHSTLTINNQLQRVNGQGIITGADHDPAFMRAILNLSSLYKGQLEQAKRGIAICDSQYVLIRDEVEAPDSSATIRWSMLTPAEVTITGKNSATLTKNGKKLTLLVQAPGKTEMKTWPCDPPPREYDAPNPGTILVGFETHIAAREKVAFNVFLIPEQTNIAHLKPVKTLHDWFP